MENITQHKGKYYFKTKTGFKEVIASTDKSLQLPKPSNEFLKQYCELNGIDKIEVEYEKESYKNRFEYDKLIIGNPDNWGNRYKLKVAPDNTITIHLI